jgi:hypothetical protein
VKGSTREDLMRSSLGTGINEEDKLFLLFVGIRPAPTTLLANIGKASFLNTIRRENNKERRRSSYCR